jgi:hypothetical protein
MRMIERASVGGVLVLRGCDGRSIFSGSENGWMKWMDGCGAL